VQGCDGAGDGAGAGGVWAAGVNASSRGDAAVRHRARPIDFGVTDAEILEMGVASVTKDDRAWVVFCFGRGTYSVCFVLFCLYRNTNAFFLTQVTAAPSRRPQQHRRAGRSSTVAQAAAAPSRRPQQHRRAGRSSTVAQAAAARSTRRRRSSKALKRITWKAKHKRHHKLWGGSEGSIQTNEIDILDDCTLEFGTSPTNIVIKLQQTFPDAIVKPTSKGKPQAPHITLYYYRKTFTPTQLADLNRVFLNIKNKYVSKRTVLCLAPVESYDTELTDIIGTTTVGKKPLIRSSQRLVTISSPTPNTVNILDMVNELYQYDCTGRLPDTEQLFPAAQVYDLSSIEKPKKVIIVKEVESQRYLIQYPNKDTSQVSKEILHLPFLPASCDSITRDNKFPVQFFADELHVQLHFDPESYLYQDLFKDCQRVANVDNLNPQPRTRPFLKVELLKVEQCELLNRSKYTAFAATFQLFDILLSIALGAKPICNIERSVPMLDNMLKIFQHFLSKILESTHNVPQPLDENFKHDCDLIIQGDNSEQIRIPLTFNSLEHNLLNSNFPNFVATFRLFDVLFSYAVSLPINDTNINLKLTTMIHYVHEKMKTFQ
jgi:hypothetical protein